MRTWALTYHSAWKIDYFVESILTEAVDVLEETKFVNVVYLDVLSKF